MGAPGSTLLGKWLLEPRTTLGLGPAGNHGEIAPDSAESRQGKTYVLRMPQCCKCLNGESLTGLVGLDSLLLLLKPYW